MNNVFRRSQILHGVFTFIYLKNWLCAIENFPGWSACILADQFVRTECQNNNVLFPSRSTLPAITQCLINRVELKEYLLWVFVLFCVFFLHYLFLSTNTEVFLP